MDPTLVVQSKFTDDYSAKLRIWVQSPKVVALPTLEGLPRFSMDWDFFIPARDLDNLARLNELLADELVMPVEPLGPRGENHIQTYQTRWGIIQFHLGVPGVPAFEEAERQSAIRQTESAVRVPIRMAGGDFGALPGLGTLGPAGREMIKPSSANGVCALPARSRAGVTGLVGVPR